MEKLAAEIRPAYWQFAELSQVDRIANLVQMHFGCNIRLARFGRCADGAPRSFSSFTPVCNNALGCPAIGLH